MFDYDVLIIDDSKPFAESIADLLELYADLRTHWAGGGDEGLEILARQQSQVVLLDLKMPGTSGLEVLKKLEEQQLLPVNYVIVLTGEITIENAVTSLQLGAHDFVQKSLVAEYPEAFWQRVRRGFMWQEERLNTEALRAEHERARAETRLIIKSVGHDMSGSYYGSLMLRLQTLGKKMDTLRERLENGFVPALEAHNDTADLAKQARELVAAAGDGCQRMESIMEMMRFFKELGEKLKHLGNAIGASSTQIVDLNEVIKAAMHIFADSAQGQKNGIKVVEELLSEPLFINATPEDLIRVFLNLFENAYKAMGEEGTLTINTLTSNLKALAIVSDTGCGIAEDKLEQIWRPDYTEWKNAQGTGLGLMICRKTVENYGGTINVFSNPGQGTRFEITFNIAQRSM